MYIKASRVPAIILLWDSLSENIFSFTRLLEKQETLPNSYLKEDNAPPLPQSCTVSWV